ncbi:hypothetical protein [Paractinoplanes lichenicola]|uniref:Lipoprotein n=1 Tax=Paractinoplanes lichenicola TaxID=2802976 RepID=A0ABS1VMN2_9ACTN|nr:hypothetical protein [Actinoplanes lichenicola]MBL7255992.1 hypothetical protein [Actinoplanes lichenicola]
MRRSQALAVAAIVLTGLAGCGSPGEGEAGNAGGAKVATLQSAAPGPTASASKVPERPRERLDTTQEEFEALLAPYNKCLKDHGVTDLSKARKLINESGPEADTFRAANKICETQYYPLPPWERDPANPEAKDFAVAVVKCLKEKGVEYVEVSENGLGWAFGGDQNDSRSISLGMEKSPECEREVAAAMK